MKNNVTKPNVTLARKKIVAEMMALNPGIKAAELSKKLNVSVETISNYRTDPDVIDMVYDRFMEIAGVHLPQVLMAQIEEAKRGNTRAAELILKHFGKLQDTLVLKVESPFMQHLKVADTEDAEIVEDVAIDIGNSFEVKDQDMLPPLPERDPLNDTPNTVARRQNKALRDAELRSERTYAEDKKRKAANERKRLRYRANKVGLKPLPPGKPTPQARKKWLDELHRRETGNIEGK
tara:strand:+ start:35 stop:739 length:705 start_codon:yes stop_codon:yes gene_type:complete